MRVISGIRKGLKLKAPDGMNTRPTTDRVKESVFNIIQTHIPSDNVLDLFSGSGALGIEALSRRCGKCTFVEYNKQAFELVRHNVEISKLSDNAHLVFSDAISYLASASEPFDIIFLDPPYNKGLIAPVLDKISERNLLSVDGIIVIETEKDGEAVLHPDFRCVRNAVYGKTVISVLVRGDEQ